MSSPSARDSKLWLLLPRSVRELPADLAATLALVVLTTLFATVPVVSETPIRVVFGLPLVLFLPGYALIAALFPEAGSPPDAAEENEINTGIDGIERVALSFGLSIAVVPLIGLALNFTPWGIRLAPILVGVGGFTTAATVIASLRRQALPEDERFSVPYREWVSDSHDALISPETRLDSALNILLVCSLLLASGSIVYAVAVPVQGESFSEFYLLTENDDGELVASGYPTELTVGESKELVVGVGNQENERTSYTIIVALQRIEAVDNETVVRESTDLARFSPTVADNETWHRPHEITPTTTGTNLRMTYLLYKDDPAPQRDIDSAYRSNYIWVNVTAQ
ncbi:DUF1616 domain-containing protein [Haloarcula marina]|uniref:DUF1616 domain-containing protein n=1 Tax=Haloarcula marina TaxID=2961574 RepID=UPI0020B8D395|nr:DUF1616 domain-containing protein [Halomicroarcula marina]